MRKFYVRGRAFFGKLAKDDSGASAVEYAILAAVVGLGIITASTNLAGAISQSFTNVGNAL